MKLQHFLMVAFAFALVSGQDTRGAKLKFASVLFRHGDRTPTNPYPTDPYKDPKNWPVGFGQLTPAGRVRALGKFFKKNYGQFLEKYSPDEVFVTSSDVDRTLMTAQTVMAALFPPQNQSQFEGSVLQYWQPIPVHTTPNDADFLFGLANCSKLQELEDKALQSPQMRQLKQKHQWMLDFTAKKSGLNFTDLTDIIPVHDALLIESQNHKPLPDWAHQVFPEPMTEMYNKLFTLDTMTPDAARLMTGPMLKSILDSMNECLANKTTIKFLAFSGHDLTIASVLNTLQLFDPPHHPPYTAALMFDLWEVEGTQPFVTLRYRNDSTKPPTPLALPSCGFKCPISDFNSILSPFVHFDLENECGASDQVPSFRNWQVLIYFAIIACSFLLAMIVFLACLNLCRRPARGEFSSLL